MHRKDPTLLLVILGTLFIYGSVTIGINLGNTIRLGSLGFGFLCFVATLKFVGLTSFFSLHNLAWLVYFGVLGFNSIQHDHSIIYSQQQIIFHLVIIFLFLIGYTLGQNRHRFQQLTVPDLFIAIVSGVFIFFSRGFHRFFGYSAQFTQGRGYIIGELNAVGIAYGFAVVSLTFLCLFTYARKTYSKILAISAAGMAFMSMITTQSRGAFIWLLLTCAIMLYSKRTEILQGLNKVGALSKTIISLMVLGVILVNIANNPDFQRAFTQFQNRLERLQIFADEDSPGLDRSAEARTLYWQRSLQAMPHWFLHGMPEMGGYPHNIFLELFERFGLLGLPLVLAFLRMPIHAFRVSASNKYKISQLETLVFLVFLFCFFQGMTSLSLQMNRFLFFGLGYTSGMLGALRSPVHAHQHQHKFSPQPYRPNSYA